jgi:hypothetical protein
MSKKIFIAAFLLAAAAAVFAVDFGLSAGGGAFLGGNFTKSETDVTKGVLGSTGGMDTSNDVALAYKTKTFDVGAFIFLDATYVELSAAYIAEIGKVTGESNSTTDLTGYSMGIVNTKTDIDENYISHVLIVDLLGKYPFALSEKLTVFPALGVGLKFPFGGNAQSDKAHDVTWGVVGKAGAGLDLSLTQVLFLRCEALFAYQFASDQEAKIEMPEDGPGYDFQFKDVGYNMGPQVKIGVGYKIL